MTRGASEQQSFGGIYYRLTKLGDIAYDRDMNASSAKRQTQFVLLWLVRVI
jgi:hypothetical protein